MLTALLLMLQPAAAAPLAPPEPPCTDADRVLPQALAGWDRLAGTMQLGGERAQALVPGMPTRLTLEPEIRIGYVLPPERSGGPTARGATIAVDVPRAGRYGIAASDRVWIDMIEGRTRVASADHGHGPRCSTIRKIVWFDLPAGRHLLQLSGAEVRAVAVMLVPPEERPRAGRR